MAKGTCSIDGCERVVYAREWCGKHYSRWRNTGDPHDRIRPTRIERLWRLFARDPDTGCWVWHGALSEHGYARFTTEGGTKIGHRVMYQILVGPVPVGLVLDHLCRNRACVNPAHLEPVTFQENMHRGAFASKTHCIHGHEYTPENTARDLVTGWRECRTCMNARSSRYYHSRR